MAFKRRHRQMHVGETLFAGAVGREERLVELEQHHRSRPHDEFAAAMGDAGFEAAGVARQAIAVVVGRQHLALLAPHRGEGAVAAAEHGGADMDRIHRRAKRHVFGRIEFAGVGKMLEQFGEGNMKRCRSLKPRGSMSVDSIFFSTGIGGASVW